MEEVVPTKNSHQLTHKWWSFEPLILLNASSSPTPSWTSMRWYICLPQLLVTSYQDLVKKLVHQFSTRRHKEMSTIILINIRHGPLESLTEYLAWFNETTIKGIHPNQKMHVWALQNELRVIHFNESLAQRPLTSLAEVATHDEWYMRARRKT